MKIPQRKFGPNPAHRYNLPPGVNVQSAKFGRTQVDIWQDAEPDAIYRGDPKREVGRASLRLWHYVVRGELSGVATSEAAARAKGEKRAWQSEANALTTRGEYSEHVYGLTREQEAAEEAAFAAYLDDIRTRFPA